MTMSTDTELIRLESLLTEVQTALKQIIEENATTVTFQGRTIARPDIDQLKNWEGELKFQVNERRLRLEGYDFRFGQYIDFVDKPS